MPLYLEAQSEAPALLANSKPFAECNKRLDNLVSDDVKHILVRPEHIVRDGAAPNIGLKTNVGAPKVTSIHGYRRMLLAPAQETFPSGFF